MDAPTLYTIGFTRKPAETFFGLLRDARVERLIDTRLNATSQLAGFAKASDLPYFLRALCSCSYEGAPELAPAAEDLAAYRNAPKGLPSWEAYAARCLAALEARAPWKDFPVERLHRACLLCSEHEPHRCHRPLEAEALAKRIPGLRIVHLV
jgi:uncharacterized protein (DUF488 family)